MDVRALRIIQQQGWMIQAVTAAGCDHHDHRETAALFHRDDLIPYLYTAGLTAAGLPELLLRLTEERSGMDWIRVATRILNGLARHTLHTELTVGQTLSTGIGRIIVTVAEPPPFSNSVRAGDVWPGMAYRLYGRRRVRVLEIIPSW